MNTNTLHLRGERICGVWRGYPVDSAQLTTLRALLASESAKTLTAGQVRALLMLGVCISITGLSVPVLV